MWRALWCGFTEYFYGIAKVSLFGFRGLLFAHNHGRMLGVKWAVSCTQRRHFFLPNRLPAFPAPVCTRMCVDVRESGTIRINASWRICTYPSFCLALSGCHATLFSARCCAWEKTVPLACSVFPSAVSLIVCCVLIRTSV